MCILLPFEVPPPLYKLQDGIEFDKLEDIFKIVEKTKTIRFDNLIDMNNIDKRIIVDNTKGVHLVLQKKVDESIFNY